MTKGLLPAALTVSMDEPASRLYETVRRVLNAEGHSEDRRFLHIWVRRNDAIAEYVEDLGGAWQFPGEAFILLADWEPVGELLDMALSRRWARAFNVEHGVEPPDLVTGYYEQAEERWKQGQRVSTFGPLLRRQRN